MPRAGNNWNNGANLGGAYRNCNNAASNANRNYGARISCTSEKNIAPPLPRHLAEIARNGTGW